MTNYLITWREKGERDVAFLSLLCSLCHLQAIFCDCGYLSEVINSNSLPAYVYKTAGYVANSEDWSDAKVFCILSGSTLFAQVCLSQYLGWIQLKNTVKKHDCFFYLFNVIFNDHSVYHHGLDVAENSMLIFRVLPHWNITPQTHDIIFCLVILYWHWADQS